MSGFLKRPDEEFDFTLARELKWHGGVAALRAEMSNKEWCEWMTYYKLEGQRKELEAKRAQARRR